MTGIKVIRYNADLYGEKLPPKKFDPAKSMEGFETFAEACARRAILIRILATGWTREIQLSSKLASCRRGDRCLSGACFVCMRRSRRNWAGNHVTKAVLADDQPWVTVSAIPSGARYALGQLNKFCPLRMKDGLRKQLSRGPLRDEPIIGGIDVNFIFERHGQSYWQPHWYFLTRASRDQVHEALSKYFTRTPFAKKPLEVRALDKKAVLVAGTYALKSLFKLEMPRKSGRYPDFVHITDHHWLELAPLLDEWGMVKRLFQKGL